jgi:hypothetical protein
MSLSLKNPLTAYPKPPFEQQPQELPGLANKDGAASGSWRAELHGFQQARG